MTNSSYSFFCVMMPLLCSLAWIWVGIIRQKQGRAEVVATMYYLAFGYIVFCARSYFWYQNNNNPANLIQYFTILGYSSFLLAPCIIIYNHLTKN